MFTEANTVEQMSLDAATKLGGQPASRMREDVRPYRGEALGDDLRPARWTYAPHTAIPRQPGDVMVEPWLREALIRLNPDIAAQPDRADEVIYNLRACILSVQADGLVRANENFMTWLRGERTMPFGHNGEHVPVRLVDAVQPANNRLTVTNQWTFQAGTMEKRFDVVFVVNGLPLVIGEAKTPTRSAVTWFDGAFQERSNIIVMVDEAHRTQEGDLGRKMRKALPNAFLFGLTGTPINRADHNTFWAFGADEDDKGYLSRYSFQDSIRDKATLPLHFETPEVRLKIDRAAIDEAFAQVTGNLSEQDHDDLAKRAAKMAVLVKNSERIRAVVQHMVTHYQTKVEPNGFKAQVVVFDRECCVLYKQMMDELIGKEASAIVMHTGGSEYEEHARSKDEEEKLLDRFRDPADPLQFVIVTNKLLTGFDAPILQVMYLDKPMKDHNLLQAICRTNRTFGQEKTHGLIVDYIGIFDDVAQALDFDEKAVQQVVSNIDALREALPVHVQKCLAFFAGVDRTVGGYEGLTAAQQCLPNNETRDKFAAEYSVLGTIWEALSPDPCLSPYQTDYKWLTQVYESVKPPSGNGKLLWHALGAKTVELINENVHLESVRDDIETLVLDTQVLEEILADAEPSKRAKEVEIKLIARLRKHLGNPTFTALGERLERIKERHEQGFLTSLEFLKQILEIAKEVVEAEKQTDPAEERDRAKEALTELFNEAKNTNTHIIVERIVADIDDIVKKVRFPDWQHTSQGERLVQRELRRTLLKYKLHTDQELFDKAYGYIRQYY
jgi:type I restriction enzyme R subunit